MKTTCRGVIELLEVSETLRKRIALETLPHYTILLKFAQRTSVHEWPKTNDWLLAGRPQSAQPVRRSQTRVLLR